MLGVFFIAPLFAPPRPVPAQVPPIVGGSPVRMALESRPLGFDPDGRARWLVVTQFYDARGNRSLILANSDFDWRSRDGRVQWQTRMRFGQPSAIVTTTHDGPLTLHVHANAPMLGNAVARTDTRGWSGDRVVAEAVGPHLVAIGWFPRAASPLRITRVDPSGRARVVAVLPHGGSSIRDGSVAAATAYAYRIDRGGAVVAVRDVTTPPDPPASTPRVFAGKGMWLFFTVNPVDDVYYRHLDPLAIAQAASRAGLRYVELRFAYGAYWEAAPEAKATVDAIVDALAARGIATVAWTVPRDTSFEDVAASVRAASYRTAAGTPVRGLAIDAERGDDFMGDDRAALWQYVAWARAALGPAYPIAVDVEDPYLENLDNARYPYAAIARYASVLQPMTYWSAVSPRRSPREVAAFVRASYRRVRKMASTSKPIAMGAETSAEGSHPGPDAEQILASLEASRRAGAIGECFFAFNGTQPEQWQALARYPW